MSEEKVKFKMRCPIEVGFLFPLKLIKNKIRSFCYMHNLNVEFLELIKPVCAMKKNN